MLRRLACIACILLLLFSAACAPVSSPEGTVLLATFYPVYVAALNITQGVPGISVECMASPQSGCLHDYQLTSSDRLKIENAALIAANGLGMESFLDDVLHEKTVLDLSAGFDGILCGHEHEHAEDGDHAHSENAHIWLGIEGAVYQAQALADGLCSFDPANAQQYRSNAEAYIAKLRALQADMQSADLNRDTAIVLYHEGFAYLADELSLNLTAIVEREPGSAPSAAQLYETAQLVGQAESAVIFIEPGFDNSEAETLAHETGAAVYTLDPVTSGELNDPDAYLTAMRANLAVLTDALGGNA